MPIWGQKNCSRLLSKSQLDFPHSFRVYFRIFSTRFECIFASSPLVSSVFSHLLHSFRVYLHIFSTSFECGFTCSPLVSSVVSHLLHSFRVYFSGPGELYLSPSSLTSLTSLVEGYRTVRERRLGEVNYTRNEWRRCKTTLETSGEDVKLHSKRVGKMLSNLQFPFASP